ncbi:MAG: hypothetical protein GY722_06075, partial [bacterium]|nr:hypothetical protein [bacterium]
MQRSSRTRSSSLRLLAFLFATIVLTPGTFAIERGVEELRLPTTLLETDPKPELGFEMPASSYPLRQIEQIPFAGAPHGFLKTTNGSIVFGVDDLKLPGHMPIHVTRVYDSTLEASLPTGAPGDVDLGPGWILSPSAYLMESGLTITMITAEGEVIDWTYQGGGAYVPVTKAPSMHMELRRESASVFVETQADGTEVTYAAGLLTGASYAIAKIVDRSGAQVGFAYQGGYLKMLVNSDGRIVTITRP